jgi:hydrogenase maturation protease
MSRQQSILVIGYGNELRGDDAIGPCIVRELERRALPGVRTLTLTQLTPELAADLAESRAAVFVDARIADEEDEVLVTVLSPAGDRAWGTHLSDPAALLAMAQLLYRHAPPAWLVTVAGATFEPGSNLSTHAVRRIDRAVSRVELLIQEMNAQEALL